jgi:hypothetical protein
MHTKRDNGMRKETFFRLLALAPRTMSDNFAIIGRRLRGMGTLRRPER